MGDDDGATATGDEESPGAAGPSSDPDEESPGAEGPPTDPDEESPGAEGPPTDPDEESPGAEGPPTDPDDVSDSAIDVGEAAGSADDKDPNPESFLEDAVIEAHHLANLTGVEEARLARRRLVDAQSAARDTLTRDRIMDAVEYLELARLQRRDVASGFAKARRHALNAEAELAHEEGISSFPIEELFDGEAVERDIDKLRERRDEAAVDSYEKLRYRVAIDRLFARVRRSVEGDWGDKPAPTRIDRQADPEDLSVEEALELASEELRLERRRQHADDDVGFQFVTPDELASAEE